MEKKALRAYLVGRGWGKLSTAKVVLISVVVLIAAGLVGLCFYAYWLLASWLVDGVFGFQGFEGVAVKVMIFLLIMAVVSAINNLGKSKG